MNYQSIIWAHQENGVDLSDSNEILRQCLSLLNSTSIDVSELGRTTGDLVIRVKNQLNNTSSRYKFVYIYGIPFLLYDVVWILALIALWSYLGNFSFLLVPFSAFVWAGIGGSIFGLGLLWGKVSDIRLRKGWIAFFVTTPIEGIFLGVALVLFFLVGFLSVNGVQTTVNNNYFVDLVAFIGGFNSRISVQVIGKIAKSLGYVEQ